MALRLRWVNERGDIACNKTPFQGLTERTAQHGAHVLDGARRQAIGEARVHGRLHMLGLQGG
jgi:hypothetical protein